MNITGLATPLSASRVQSEVGFAVLNKAMDAEESMGQGIVQMMDAAAMERSVNPDIGANFDMRV